jgi:hypothetical protein
LTVSFLSPLAMLVALGVAIPLAALLRMRSRGSRTRGRIGLPEPRVRRYVLPAATLILGAVLLGFAAGQPVIEFEQTTRVRTDAQALIVLDITRSMLARQRPGAASRIARAKAAALTLREAIPEVPVGLASLTDRTLPHLFPSADEEAFRVTLARSIGIERPPPAAGLQSRATRLESIAAVATRGFYSARARNRALVVLTDGESLPATRTRLDLLFRRPPGIRTLFIQFWSEDESVFAGRLPEPAYRPDPTARATLERFAAQVGGTVFTEGELSAARRSLRKSVGTGPTVVGGERREHVALAPFLAASAFLPFLLALWRRDR